MPHSTNSGGPTHTALSEPWLGPDLTGGTQSGLPLGEKGWGQVSRFGPGGPTPLSSRVLPQQVWELEQELTKQTHTISESKAKVSYLQAQLNQSEKHLQGQKQLEGEMQGKMELAQGPGGS